MTDIPGLLPTGAALTALLSSSCPSQANVLMTASRFAEARSPELVAMFRVARNKQHRVRHLVARTSQSRHRPCVVLYA